MTRVTALRVLAHDAVAAAGDVLAGEAPLARAARESGIDDDTIAELRVLRARAERIDLADDVRAEAVRELVAEVRKAASRPDVDVIERYGADADAHLARAGVGQIDGRALEHLG